MRKTGIRGEHSGKNKTLYLHHVWINTLKDLAKESGKSQGEVVEWALSASLEDFRAKFGLNDKAKSEKEVKKIKDVEDAFALGKKELVRFAQETSEQRYGKYILSGEYQSVAENYLREMEPQKLWDKIRGRQSKRLDGWIDEGWQPV